MGEPWKPSQWAELEAKLRTKIMEAENDQAAWRMLTRTARGIMSHYTTSFFIVSRFLPPEKRDRVEVIYAGVRYPDEVVDTFEMDNAKRFELLAQWQRDYEKGLEVPSIREGVRMGLTPIMAGFGKVVRESQIPPEHYPAFLSAMRMDIQLERFKNLENLIKHYVYGSAIVVGYFLTHVYGASAVERMPEALKCSRELGIALQLTNFIRDVSEDYRRGRVYLPEDLLKQAGADMSRLGEMENRKKVISVIRQVGEHARRGYAKAKAGLEAFSPDCRVAIEACIDVYGRLNEQIIQSDDCIARRESVGMWQKFKVLPRRKYWHLPLYAAGVR